MNLLDKGRLLIYLNKLYGQLQEAKVMKDPKTTISGVIATVGLVLKLFKIDIPQEVADALIIVGVFAVGFFSKDGDK